MESVVAPDRVFWRNKRVLVTGHTGFKGSWLSIWLQEMGVRTFGYALSPPTQPALYEQAGVGNGMTSRIGDIRDHELLTHYVLETQPEVIFHLAAQPLVRASYETPRETYETNVLGTVNVLEAARQCESVRSVVVVTTDKCYENREWHWGYREVDTLGGYDPYSSSKAAAEIVVSSYRASFFGAENRGQTHSVTLATARAGNVIGPGDWATDRLVPDLVRAAESGEPVVIRNPAAIRPWQHVLEPLAGYLILAERQFDVPKFGEAWNFGPLDADCQSVMWIANEVQKHMPSLHVRLDDQQGPHEASFLKLDISKAVARLGWKPNWDLQEALRRTIEGYQDILDDPASARDCIRQQIRDYLG